MKNVHHSESDVLSHSSWNIRRGEKKVLLRGKKRQLHKCNESDQGMKRGGEIKKNDITVPKASQPIQERKKKRRTCRWWDWQEINSFPFFIFPLSRQGCLYTSQFLRAILRPAQPQTLYTWNMCDTWNIASRDLANRLRRYTSNLHSIPAEETFYQSQRSDQFIILAKDTTTQSTVATWG